MHTINEQGVLPLCALVSLPTPLWYDLDRPALAAIPCRSKCFSWPRSGAIARQL